MGPSRRTKPTNNSSSSSTAVNGANARAATATVVASASSIPVAYPPTPPSQEDEEYDLDGVEELSTRSQSTSTQNYSNHNRRSNGGSMSGAYPLQRGSACLSCRKRKLKCSGSRPVCEQCSKANRAADCEFDDGKAKTRTQLLQEKISMLESRVRELEGNPSTGGPTSTSADQGHLMQLNDGSYQDATSSVRNNFHLFFFPFFPFSLVLIFHRAVPSHKRISAC